MTTKEKTEILMRFKSYAKFPCINIFDNKKYRAAREDEKTVFVYSQGKKRYGWRYSISYFIEHFNFNIPKNENDEWHKHLKKAIKCMDNSGLWPDIKHQFENLLLMSWEDNKAIDEIYWRKWDKTEKEISDMFKPYADKYPFAFSVSDDGFLQLDTNYTWEKSQCKLKSMYFGKYENKQIKEAISNALLNGKKYSTGRIRVNYDVSFDFDPDKKAAWYSEEYKDCGNGHYYIALDGNTALFCEDD